VLVPGTRLFTTKPHVALAGVELVRLAAVIPPLFTLTCTALTRPPLVVAVPLTSMVLPLVSKRLAGEVMVTVGAVLSTLTVNLATELVTLPLLLVTMTR